jgi:hypothetical protein
VTSVPSTLERFHVPACVLRESRELLAEPGERGFEAAVVWVGRCVDEITAEISAVHRPEQVSYATEYGLSVEITQQGITDLIADLDDGTFALVRLHTHGTDDTAHSPLDDSNFIIGHQGAISVVVPRFASQPIVLTDCSVYELRHGYGWLRLRRDDIASRFHVDA